MSAARQAYARLISHVQLFLIWTRWAQDVPTDSRTSNSSGASGAGMPAAAARAALSIGENGSDKPFACAVRIVVRGQTVEQALEQGKATVREVQASLVRGPVATSRNRARSQHYVLWIIDPRNSLRVQPEVELDRLVEQGRRDHEQLIPRTRGRSSARSSRRSCRTRAHGWTCWSTRARMAASTSRMTAGWRIQRASSSGRQQLYEAGRAPLVRLAINVSSAVRAALWIYLG